MKRRLLYAVVAVTVTAGGVARFVLGVPMSKKSETKRRQEVALSAIRGAFGTEADEYGATLFISHHLKEVGANYWQAHLGTDKPAPAQVLGILKFHRCWGGDDGMDVFDFTLPGDITNYVISVRFDSAGEVKSISMES